MTTIAKVFVVDSDQSARGGLIRLLRGAGHDALGFGSVTEFLEALDPGTLGCLVLDSGAVERNGEGLRAVLKTSGRQLPVIMVSARDDHRIRLKARELKAMGFYRKPVDGPALLDAVKWAMEVAGIA